MYNEYFGLRQAPFRITPDTALFYTGGSRGDVLDALVYAITSGEGIVKVIGEVGTGKTMLCRMLEERLPDNVQIAYLANPSLTPEDILHAVALELELDVASNANRLQVMHRLQEALLSRHANNQRVVVLVEEAQSMPVDTLEEIRLLSNLETKNEKLLQIVLFGQPELDENLAKPEIRQLRERITHSFALSPLGREEVKDYVAFRLHASGYRGRDAFTSDAYRTMSRASEGLTRRVNIIADKAMLAAFADNTHDVSVKHVKSAIADSEFSSRRQRKRYPPLFATAAVAVVAAGALGWYAGNQAGSGSLSVPLSVDTQQPAQAAVQSPQALPKQSPEQSPEPSPEQLPTQPEKSPALLVQAPESESSTQTASLQDTVAVRAASPAVMADPPSEPLTDVVTPVVTTPAPPAQATAVAMAPSAPSAVDTAASAGSIAATSGVREEAQSNSSSVTPAKPSGALTPSVPVTQNERIASPSTAAMSEAADSARAAVAAATPDPAPIAVAVATPAPAPIAVAAAIPDAAPATEAAAVPDPASKAAAIPPAPPAAAKVEHETLLQTRLARTREWLGGVAKNHYSIQLLATNAEQRHNLEAFLSRRERAGQLEQIFVYETKISARKWYGVLFGEFASYSEAREALRELPRELRLHDPFIRNVRDINALG